MSRYFTTYTDDSFSEGEEYSYDGMASSCSYRPLSPRRSRSAIPVLDSYSSPKRNYYQTCTMSTSTYYSDYQEVKNELERLKVSLMSALRWNRLNNEQIETLETRNRSLENENIVLNIETRKSYRKNNELESTISILRERLAACRKLSDEKSFKDASTIAQLERENSRLLLDLEEMQDAFEVKNAVGRIISTDLDKISKETRLYGECVAEMHFEINTLRHSLNDKATECQILLQDRNQLLTKLRDHALKLEMYENNISRKMTGRYEKGFQTDDTKAISKEIKLLQDENAKLKSSNEGIALRLRHETTENNRLSKKYKELERENDKVKKDVREKESELFQKSQKSNQNNQEILDLKFNLRAKDRLLNQQTETKQQLIAEKNRLQRELDACHKDTRTKSYTIYNTNKDISQLDKLKREVETTAIAKEKWNEEKKQTVKQYEQIIRELKRELQLSEEDRKRTNGRLEGMEHELNEKRTENSRLSNTVMELVRQKRALPYKDTGFIHSSTSSHSDNQMLQSLKADIKIKDDQLRKQAQTESKLKQEVVDLKGDARSLYEKQSDDAKTIRDLRKEIEELTKHRTHVLDKASEIQKLEHELEMMKDDLEKLYTENKLLKNKQQAEATWQSEIESEHNKHEKHIQQIESENRHIQTENVHLKQDKEKLERQVERIKKSLLVESDKRSDSNVKEIEMLERKLTDERKQKHELNRSYMEKQKENNELQRALSSINAERDSKVKDLQRQVNGKDEALDSLRKEMHRVENELSRYKETADKANKEEFSLRDQVRSLKTRSHSEDTTTKRDLKENQKRVQELNHQIDNLNEEIRQLRETLRRHEENSKTNDNILQKEQEKISKENRELKKRLQALQSELDSSRENLAHKSRSSKDSGLKRQLEEVTSELNDVKRELDDTKSRLSKLMGQKLTDNNPNIADLSDKNRPTKLAERYTELYDNQWTDAFEVIDRGDEEETIGLLREILEGTMGYCRKMAGKQLDDMTGALMFGKQAGAGLPDVIKKQLKDSRKAMAESTAHALFQEFRNGLKSKPDAVSRAALKVPKYLEEAFITCWLMSVQDPPVVLAGSPMKGDRFNSDIYKAYTESGPKVNYVVWPVLYLNEGGAVLCKGVAQGFGKK